ncbi:MAG: SMC-Scp complex subunit ScpB [Planctomycetes bacterium]|nr:SMC-Scp complex subunit ScpB [Planctomycetota bacterium]
MKEAPENEPPIPPGEGAAEDSSACGAAEGSFACGAAAAEASAALADGELDRVVEALLFSTADALSAARLAEAAGGVSPRRVQCAIERLRAHYAATLRAFDIHEIAGGYRLYSRPEFQEHVSRLERVRAPEKLSAAALETLAIVAYRQPLVRAEIDAIRGVQCGPVLRSLIDRKLIRVVGRSDQPGRPLLYGTTKRFLDHFGLASVKDLPRVEELKAP